MTLATIILVIVGPFPTNMKWDGSRYEFQRPLMGTQARIVLYAADGRQAQRAVDAAFARLDVLNRILSDYLEDSELNQLCAQAGGDAVPVSPELFVVLQHAQKIAKESDGAFDVTVGPLVQLWRRSRRQRELPSEELLAKAKAVVGWRHVRLNAERRTVQLLLPRMKLDLGGLAKGYAADEAQRTLRQAGVTQALVAIGGDIVVSDAPPGAAGWTIQVAPLRPGVDPPQPALLLKNAGISTAGDTEQFVEIEGRRYAHIVDPRTGLGLRHRACVTVVASTGLVADALDTAAYVLGPERGLALVEQSPCAAAWYAHLTPEGTSQTLASRRWAAVPRSSD